MYKKTLFVFSLLFCLGFIYAAPPGQSPCVVTIVYVGNIEAEADATFERYKNSIISSGWTQGNSFTHSLEGFYQYINLLYFARQCRSIQYQGLEDNRNTNFTVRYINYNNKAMLLCWLDHRNNYTFSIFFDHDK